MQIIKVNRDHISAIFTLAENVPQPKLSGIKNGYSPHHKFADIDYLVSGRHTYTDDRIHYPGEAIKVSITFASWQHICHAVKVGDCFEVREMQRIVGYGQVVEVCG